MPIPIPRPRSWIAARPGQFHTWDDLMVTAHREHQHRPFRRQQAALMRVCENLIDPLCRHLGRKARITSGFRSPRVNALVGGVDGSRHTVGEAIDFDFEGLTAFDILELVDELGITYDKLIAYQPNVGGHVHGSWVSAEDNRGRMLECYRAESGKKAYRSWAPGGAR